MTDEDDSTDGAVPGEDSIDDDSPAEVPDRSRNSQDTPGAGETFPSLTDWEGLVDVFRTRVQEQIAVWPEKVAETIDLIERKTSDAVPGAGEILIYVHGYLGEGRLDGMNISGENQAAALRVALADEYGGSTVSPPTVVAATWNSSTIWPRATRRAITAGKNLAQWLSWNADEYDRVVLVGHSLGGRVVLNALGPLEEDTVDSVGLLGAAVEPEPVCGQYRAAIESAVREGVFNYHSRNDAIVCRLYNFREGHDGIGCMGTVGENGAPMDGLPANYRDVDVSETVHRHMDYFKPLKETAAGNCVRDIVERQLESESST